MSRAKMIFMALLLAVAAMPGLLDAREVTMRHRRRDWRPEDGCVTCDKDDLGRIKKRRAERDKFLRSLGFEKVPKGYRIKYVVPLSQGGEDRAENMQLVPKGVRKRRN